MKSSSISSKILERFIRKRDEKRMTQKAQGLVSDIGGTNIRFAIADRGSLSQIEELKCADYAGPVEAALAYCQKTGLENIPKVGVFDVAGPVEGDWFDMTNNDWAFSVEETAQRLGIDSLHLLNDFEAIALGIPQMESGDLSQIGGSAPVDGAPIAVIGPGTGLGTAGLLRIEGKHMPLPGEGGHVTMSVKTQREFDIIAALKQVKYSHVSAERVCSGKGLVNLYEAICHLDGVQDALALEPEEISEKGMNGECKICAECLDLLCGFLGVVAGNLAISLNAKGGVYIAGGIPARLGDYFLRSRFRREFEDKGRYTEYMKGIPAYLVTHPYIALHGLRYDLLQRGLI